MNTINAVFAFILLWILLIAIFIPPWARWWNRVRQKRKKERFERAIPATSDVPVDTGAARESWRSGFTELQVIYKKVPLLWRLGLYRKKVTVELKISKNTEYLLALEIKNDVKYPAMLERDHGDHS